MEVIGEARARANGGVTQSRKQSTIININVSFRADKRAKEEAEAKKVDPTDFESFSENFDKIEKQHRKAGKKMTQAGSGCINR